MGVVFPGSGFTDGCGLSLGARNLCQASLDEQILVLIVEQLNKQISTMV